MEYNKKQGFGVVAKHHLLDLSRAFDHGQQHKSNGT